VRAHIPNLLTAARLLLAIVFFVALNQYRHPDGHPLLLLAAGVLFIVAAVTDALDGHLARKWRVESAFGRIMDPVCDKVLVLGAFIYLAGPRFMDASGAGAGGQVTGIYPWMVVVMLSRELLVTSVRAALESRGVQFGAMKLGKWKMILQSVVVPLVILIVWLDPHRPALAWVRDIAVWLTVLVTLASAWPYLARCVPLMRESAARSDNT